MKKTFVLDASVLLHSADSILAFDDNTVVIPETVIEEINNFRKDGSDRGANARQVGALLDQLRLRGHLLEGVPLSNGGVLKVELNHTSCQLPSRWDVDKNDNRLLQVCLGLHQDKNSVYLVTKDVFTRIKADIIGIPVQDFHHDQAPELHYQYQGRSEVFTRSSHIEAFYEKGFIHLKDLFIRHKEDWLEAPLIHNQFVTITAFDNYNQKAIGIAKNDQVALLKYIRQKPFGVIPRNTGQKFYQEALMSPPEEIPLVICKGPAGTAKTFYALAVGLHKIMNSKDYRKILVCRPYIGMDESIGFLPGTEAEKLGPLMRGINDNLEILIDNDEKLRYDSEKKLKDKVEEFYSRKIINVEAVAYLRGRSIAKHWIIIDEAQNLTPNQIKGIITRAGPSTKIVIIGDPTQIDHPYLDARSNGLSYASEKMKGSPLCCQISLLENECERSLLAQEAAQRL